MFCPKYRYKILEGEVGKYVERLLYRLVEQKDKVEIIELNVQRDHIHMVIEIAPKHRVSEIVGYLKGKTAIRLFEKYKALGKQYWGRHLWSRGYCVSTVGIDEEKIVKYVRWQEKQEGEIEQDGLFS